MPFQGAEITYTCWFEALPKPIVLAELSARKNPPLPKKRQRRYYIFLRKWWQLSCRACLGSALPCAPRATVCPTADYVCLAILASPTDNGLVPRHADRTNGLPAVTVVVVHVAIARTKVEVQRVAATARVERTRPVVAVGPGIAEVAAEAVASSGQED